MVAGAALDALESEVGVGGSVTVSKASVTTVAEAMPEGVGMTRKTLSAVTGLSQPTISRALSSMVNAGKVVNVGAGVYVRKFNTSPHDHVDEQPMRTCLRCGSTFRSLVQHGRTIYRLCQTCRADDDGDYSVIGI